MATRNIIPRADGEGQVGLAAQAWGKVYADEIYEGGVRVQTGESADDKTVKASSTDATPGYLDAKVDGTTLEVSGYKLQIKSGGHAHAQSEVTGLDAALSGKAASTHYHVQSDVTGLADAMAGKASTDVATTSAAGLMSAADKVRLDALELKALTIASIESY